MGSLSTIGVGNVAGVSERESRCVLLAVVAVAAGAGLVNRSATWLRVVVAICFALLVWSVLQVLSDGVDERPVQGLAGAVGAVVGLVVLVRKPAPVLAPSGPRSRGSHAR
jgi:asparagine N-glycosylation enzyme membrane subunit Stt3